MSEIIELTYDNQIQIVLEADGTAQDLSGLAQISLIMDDRQHIHLMRII